MACTAATAFGFGFDGWSVRALGSIAAWQAGTPTNKDKDPETQLGRKATSTSRPQV